MSIVPPYRGPELQPALAARERSRMIGALVQIALGGFLTIAIVGAILLWIAVSDPRMFLTAGGFIVMCFIFAGIIALMFWVQWRNGGGYQQNRAWDMELGDIGWYGAYNSRTREVEGIVTWEFLLFAARMVLEGWSTLRFGRQLTGVDSARTSEILALLLNLEDGIPIQQLAKPGENLLQLSRCVLYLSFNEWVGISEDGQKIWALSSGRDELRNG